MSRDMTKQTTWVCAQRRLDQLGHPPSLIRVFACAQWVAKGPRFLHADSEDSDQTGRMPRLIWVFAGHTATLFVLSCRGSCFDNSGHSRSFRFPFFLSHFVEQNRWISRLQIVAWFLQTLLTQTILKYYTTNRSYRRRHLKNTLSGLVHFYLR